MNKLYVSADIEGVCGIADWKETELAEAQGAYFREQMGREVRAVCEAACGAGVGEILVKDAHDSGRNINPMALPENVRLLRSWTRSPLSMMAGIDESFDGVAFVGYHSAAGTNGNPLAHTMNGNNVHVLVNGEPASEFLINSYTAALFSVPVLFLSGDRMLCERAARLDPAIGTVAVSEGMGGASLSIHPNLAVAKIRETAAAAFAANAVHALKLPTAFHVEIRFRLHHLAYRGSFYPGAKQTGPFEVAYSSGSWMEVLQFLFFVL